MQPYSKNHCWKNGDAVHKIRKRIKSNWQTASAWRIPVWRRHPVLRRRYGRTRKARLPVPLAVGRVRPCPNHCRWRRPGDTHKENAEYLFDNFKQVTVVLHRYDYSNPQIRLSYEKVGHQTFCHGNGTPWEKDFDPMFLVNQRNFLNQ